MKDSLYKEIIDSYCYESFCFNEVRIEQPNGMMKSTKRDYDLIVFNPKKIIFFARLDEPVNDTDVILKLRGALNSLVVKLRLSPNDFIVCGANDEKCFFLNKYNDRLFSFDCASDECFKIVELIENDLSYGVDVFDYNRFRSLSDVITLSPRSVGFSKGVKEKVKTDATGKTFVCVHGTWREASDLDTETLYPMAAFGGVLGLHLFHQKKRIKGLFYAFTLGLCGIGWFFDCLEMLLGIYKDPDGKYLVPLENKLSGIIMLFLGGIFSVIICFVFMFLFKFVFGTFSDAILTSL